MSVSLYDFALFVHISAAIYLIASSLVTPAIIRRVREASSRGELLTWLGFLRQATRTNPPVAFVLLGSGIYLGSAGWWNTGWFYVSVVAWVMSSALAGAVIRPAAMRIASAAAADVQAPIDADVDRLRHARGWVTAEKLMLGSDIAMLWIMIVKPTLPFAIGTLVALMAAVVLASILLGQRRATLSRVS